MNCETSAQESIMKCQWPCFLGGFLHFLPAGQFLPNFLGEGGRLFGKYGIAQFDSSIGYLLIIRRSLRCTKSSQNFFS